MKPQTTDFYRWMLTVAIFVPVWRSAPWPVTVVLFLLTINAEVTAFSLRRLRLLLIKAEIIAAVKQ